MSVVRTPLRMAQDLNEYDFLRYMKYFIHKFKQPRIEIITIIILPYVIFHFEIFEFNKF